MLRVQNQLPISFTFCPRKLNIAMRIICSIQVIFVFSVNKSMTRTKHSSDQELVAGHSTQYSYIAQKLNNIILHFLCYMGKVPELFFKICIPSNIFSRPERMSLSRIQSMSSSFFSPHYLQEVSSLH